MQLHDFIFSSNLAIRETVSTIIDGVVLIDPDYIKERKVFGHVLAAFKYGGNSK